MDFNSDKNKELRVESSLPINEITPEESEHINAYCAALDACGIDGVRFFDIEPDDFYNTLMRLQGNESLFQNTLILCVGGTYRSAHAKSVFTYLGFETADGFVDLSKYVEGMSIAEVCTKLRRGEVQIAADGSLNFNSLGHNVKSFIIFADESTLGSLIRSLAELSNFGQDPSKLKISFILVLGDENLHRQYKNKIIPPEAYEGTINIHDNSI
jgi:hypothetical protein